MRDVAPSSFYCQSQNTRIGEYMAYRGYCYWLSSDDLTQQYTDLCVVATNIRYSQDCRSATVTITLNVPKTRLRAKCRLLFCIFARISHFWFSVSLGIAYPLSDHGRCFGLVVQYLLSTCSETVQHNFDMLWV